MQLSLQQSLCQKKSFSAQTYMQAANIQKFVSSFKFINALSWFALLITIEKQMFNVKIFYLCVFVFQSILIEL